MLTSGGKIGGVPACEGILGNADQSHVGDAGEGLYDGSSIRSGAFGNEDPGKHVVIEMELLQQWHT